MEGYRSFIGSIKKNVVNFEGIIDDVKTYKWTLKMTSRQRVINALSHKEPDRTPIFEYVLQPPVADAVLGRPYVYGNRLNEYIREKGWEEAIWQQAIDMVEIARNLSHDMIYAVPNPLPPSPEPKQSLQEKKELQPDDPVEEMLFRVKQMEENPSSLQEESFLIYIYLRKAMEKFELDLPILAPDYGHGVWNYTTLMQAMALAPELVSQYYRLITKGCLALAEKYIKLGIEMIGVGGDFAGNKGPLISPLHYRKFIMPEVRKISRFVHSYGKVAVNASDGNLWPVIEDFLIGCEVDGYIEIDVRAGMDLKELKKRFGGRITFLGNLDCANLISFGTPEEVKEHTRKCLKDGWGNGGHILCCNNAITETVPVANYLAIYEAYREFFGI
jgi:hypothetical protein